MPRDELRLTDLRPVRGGDANKRRPEVVVSNDMADAAAWTGMHVEGDRKGR